VLGPAPAPLARLRGRHRVQLLVKGGERAAVHAVAAAVARTAAALPRAVRALVDTDPYNML
jgi:primosomal protein N' (replication factor Y)